MKKNYYNLSEDVSKLPNGNYILKKFKIHIQFNKLFIIQQ